MVYIPSNLGNKIEKKLVLLFVAVFLVVWWLGRYGWFFLWYFQRIACSPQLEEPGILACLVVCFLLTGAGLFFLYIVFYRNAMLTGFEANGSGIRVFIGRKTIKTVMWQEFRYVGELKAFPLYRRGRRFPERIIVCSPEQPWLMYGYTDAYGFRRKGAILIEWTPEYEQIMKPYYKGTLSADE